MSISTSISSIKSSSVCLDGWSYYNFNCYNFNIETGYTWSACQSQCNSFRASMLCIPDSTTNTWIANQLLELEYSYSWIGYSDLQNKDGNYEWVSGCSSSYTYWDINSNYNSYDCAYIASDGFWGSTSDVGSTRTICICEYNPEPTSVPTIVPSAPTVISSTISPTSLSPTTTTSSTSSSLSDGLIVFIVVASFYISGFLMLAILKMRRDAKVGNDDNNYNDSSSNQENNDFQLFPDGEDGYGNISSSFPVASSNQGFPVTSTNQEYGHSNMYPTFHVTSSNQEFPVTSSNQGFHVTNSNQEYGHNNIYPSFPVASSNQGYGNNPAPYPVTNNNEENGYGNIESIRFE